MRNKNLFSKLFLALSFACGVSAASAQIKLEENKTHSQKNKQEYFQQISNFGKYQANVVAYAILCKFEEPKIQIVTNSYLSNLQSFNLPQADATDLTHEYKQEVKRVLDGNVGKSLQDLGCEKFRPEFEKIVDFSKDPQKYQKIQQPKQ